MAVRFHLAQDRCDLPISINDKRAAFRAHVSLAKKILLHPNMVGLHQFALRISEQGKRQSKLSNEFFVALERINAHSEYRPVGFDLVPSIAQPTCLPGAARRIVLRVKIEDQRRAAKISQRDFSTSSIFSADSQGAKIWRGIANP